MFHTLRTTFVIFLLFIANCQLSIAQNSNYAVQQTIPIRGAVYSSLLATENNNVVIGSHKSRIYFFNNLGEKLQEFHTKMWVHATPSIVNDSLVSLASYDGRVYFFNENGVLKRSIKPGGRVFTNLAQVDSSTAVYGTERRKIVFYNLLNNSSQVFKTKGITHGSPVVFSNKFSCIGSNDKHLYIFNEKKELSTRYKTNGWIMHSKPLEIDSNSIVLASYDKNIYSIDLEGRTNWKFATKGKVHASPRKIDNEKFVVGSFDKHIYIIDRKSVV